MAFRRVSWLSLFYLAAVQGCNCGNETQADGGNPSALDGGDIWGACADSTHHQCFDYAGPVTEQTRLVEGPADCADGGGAWSALCQPGQLGTCTLRGDGGVRTYWRFYEGAAIGTAPTVCGFGHGSWTTP